jgi:hypothetical protein
MNGIIPECPACRERMDEGHVLVPSQQGFGRASWFEGAPEKGGLYGYKVKGKRKIDTVTYRCPRCGWLVWFAPETTAPS